MLNGQRVKFGNLKYTGIVNGTRNDGPTPDYEETLVFFDDGDRCWVGSCDLTVIREVVVPQEVLA